ncbi:uncharacterized protein [Antedon mediterranea]|uniref:uncharacterized protein n=1 Tax=Antedon mediterranea TaxID=105859 RepID=UPI003AF460B0
MDIAGRWGQDTTVQTTPTEPTIQGNPFANGTLMLIKWNASTCDISNYHVIYHYELSGGIFMKGTTSEKEVVFEIQFCKNYTFSVLASYVNVYGKSDTRTIISRTDCDPDSIGPMSAYGILIGSLLAAVFTVTVMLTIIKRFILRRTKKDVDKSSSRPTTQQNVCTIDTNYQGLCKKYEYESGKSDVGTSSAEPIHTNTEVPEHFSDFTNMKTRRENETSVATVNDSDEPVYADPEQEREPEPVYDKSEYARNNSTVATYSDEPVYTDPEQEREPEHVYDKSEYEKNNSTVATYSDEPVYTDPEQEMKPEPQFVYNENEYNNIKSTRSVISSVKHVHPDPEPLPERISGNTESESQEYKPIELSKLRDYVMKHLLKKEFEALNSLFPDDARRADFSFKKTFHDVLFLTKGCSQLSPDVDSGVDYVNDSFIERYRDRHTFIVTRNPSLNTTIDFWRLVFDYKSDVIVQLNEVEDLNCAVYLPKKKNERLKCYEYTVTLEATVLNQFGIERRFILEKDNTVRQMIQYEVKQWSKNEPVPKVNAFVKFVMKIMDGYGKSSNNTPITVHCIDGVCRSGLFCLVYSMIEKMREEKIVDVFQTLKALRSASTNMVDSQIQYNFCYEAALCYLRWCEDNNVMPNN